MKKKQIRIFKKISDLVRFQFHKPETKKPNQKIKKPNKKTRSKLKPSPLKKSKKNPKKQYSFWFLI